jgi:hypothetical protein
MDFKPFNYQVSLKSNPQTFFLPKATPKLASEQLMGKTYPSAALECGTDILYQLQSLDATKVA